MIGGPRSLKKASPSDKPALCEIAPKFDAVAAGDVAAGPTAGLASVVAAQRWDICGLTEQRDAGLQQIARQKKEIAKLNARIAALGEQLASSRSEAAALKRKADRSRELSLQIRDLLHNMKAILNPARNGYLVPGEVADEAAVIRELGLFDDDFYARANPELAGLEDPLGHYLEKGEAAGLSPVLLFDPEYYRRQLGADDQPSGSLLLHYAATGWKRRLSPHPLFDPAYYREQYLGNYAELVNPLIHFLRLGAAAGCSPHPLFRIDHYRGQRGIGTGELLVLIEDFLAAGWRQGASSHPLFDLSYYLRENPDLAGWNRNPLVHYLEYGDQEGRQPNPLFDPKYYRTQAAAAEDSAGNSLCHYIRLGCALGLQPHPVFDTAYYYECNPDVRADRVNALVHFFEFGTQEGRRFHPLFDVNYLRRANPQLFEPATNPLLMFVQHPRCRELSPTPLFDPQFYLECHPEVRNAPSGPFIQYLGWGARQGRNPHRLFDTGFYAAQVDWAARSSNPLVDYVRHGVADGLSPHPLFDSRGYLERYPDVARNGANPLVHYIEDGSREGRLAHVLFDSRFFRNSLKGRPRRCATLLEEFIVSPIEDPKDPHPLFDCRHYLRNQPEAARAGTNPLLHYISTPAGQAGDPHILFDEQFYLQQYPDLAGGATSLLEHYCTVGYKELASPHPLFDSAYAHEQAPDLIRSSVVPLQRYVERALEERYDPNRWFDTYSYNIVHQGADSNAVNPFKQFLERHPQFRPPRMAAPAEPAAAAANGFDQPAAQFSEQDLRRTLGSLRAKSSGRHEGPIAAATAADVVASGALERFVAAHGFHSFGTIGAGRQARARGVALYAVYSASGGLSATHRATLASLRDAGYATVLINSTRAKAAGFLAQARAAADVVVLRDNGGRDFASWVAVLAMMFADVAAFDHCLFVNDSLLGPVGSLTPTWRAFDASPALVWGLTESVEVRRHIQSSFFIMRRQALQSSAFVRYLSGYGFPEERNQVVRQGELALGAMFDASGIATEVMARFEDVADTWTESLPAQHRWFDDLAAGRMPPAQRAFLPRGAERSFGAFAENWSRRLAERLRRGEPANPQLIFWDVLYQKFNFPFIKRDLATVNPFKTPSVVRLVDVIDPAYHRTLFDCLAEVVPSYRGLPVSVLRVSAELLGKWRGHANERERDRGKPQPEGRRKPVTKGSNRVAQLG